MFGPRLGVLVLLALAGCATTSPPPAEVPAAAPEIAAAPASPVASPNPALPHLAIGPRRSWRPIRLSRGARMAQAYVASDIVANPDGTRRVWMVINLLEPIRLPETGGYARSAAYLADFRCDPHAWNPLQGIWYTQRNAVGEALREQQRGPGGIRDVGEGSFMDIFVNAACAEPARRRGR